MNEYKKQAIEFLKDCNATMEIMYLGKETNENWDEKRERDTYMVNICTPKGSMQVKFWDSFNNTVKNSDLCRINKRRIKPTAYDIFSCLEKYDVGDIEDFMLEFGFEIKKRGDFKRIQNIYNAVIKEYQDICRCFTPEQIEVIREIQ